MTLVIKKHKNTQSHLYKIYFIFKLTKMLCRADVGRIPYTFEGYWPIMGKLSYECSKLKKKYFGKSKSLVQRCLHIR